MAKNSDSTWDEFRRSCGSDAKDGVRKSDTSVGRMPRTDARRLNKLAVLTDSWRQHVGKAPRYQLCKSRIVSQFYDENNTMITYLALVALTACRLQPDDVMLLAIILVFHRKAVHLNLYLVIVPVLCWSHAFVSVCWWYCRKTSTHHLLANRVENKAKIWAIRTEC